MRRGALGTAAALAAMAALAAGMIPIRGHLSIATTALVLVIPVVIGVVVGGFTVGVLGVIAGFLVYDFFFIPPYLTLWVGAPENWAALGVYAAVMLPVARVVAGMNAARAEARRQGREIRELFALSDLLVEDQPLEVLLGEIVTSLAGVFDSPQVALLLPEGSGLEIAAAVGEPLSGDQLRRVLPEPGTLTKVDAAARDEGNLLVLALTAAGRPIGLLVIAGSDVLRHEREPLLLFANQIALAVERSQLREEALRARLTEEMARLAKTLVAAVSHDLRAPLAAIKASSSTLVDPDLHLDSATTRRLARLVDSHADRLAELVQNLLDMSRIQAGVLTPRTTITTVAQLIEPISEDHGGILRGHRLEVTLPAVLPPVDVDLVLMARVLTNLVDNAARHAPKETPILIDARVVGESVELSVSDSGPGVPPERRGEVFELFARRDTDAGAGLGLSIAKTFVEAHGQRIWVEQASGGGARFCFSMPVARMIPEEQALVASARR